MSGFDYNPIPKQRIESVELIPPSDPEYRDYLEDLMSGKSEGQIERERLIEQNPDEFESFKENVDCWTASVEAFQSYLGQKYNKIINDVDRVCGNCIHHKDDDYRDGDQYIVCWKNAPQDSGGRPRKLEVDDDFAENCAQFRPLRDLRNFDLSLVLKAYEACEDGADDHNRDWKYYAKRVAWEEHLSNVVGSWNKQRAEAFLRDFNSDTATESPNPGTGGVEFENEARDLVSQYIDEIRDDRVFKMTLSNGHTRYKECDVICGVDGETYILELFTQRRVDEKREQLDDYIYLYEEATGETANGVLLTDKSRVVSFDLLSEFVKNTEGSDSPE